MELGFRPNRTLIEQPPALSLRGISKRFGQTLALDAAELLVRPGSVHALLGENGAGKSTLMRIAFGMQQPDTGTIEVSGRTYNWKSSAAAIDAGLGMVHQHFLIVPAMTVAENVALGDRGFFRAFNPRVAAERVRRIGELTGLVLDPSARACDLPVGAQQRLEIVKAMARDARLLIFDEPTAVLSPHETVELYAWMRRFVEGGKAVVLITHKVREALAVADDVTVLRRGRSVLTGQSHSLAESDVVGALLGEAATAFPAARSPTASVVTPGKVVIRLNSVSTAALTGGATLRECSAEVRAGEILGIAGVEGAGQRELLRVFAGRLVPERGVVTGPARTGFVPEDRQRDALIGELSLVENFAMKEAAERSGTMPWTSYEARTANAIQSHDVRAGSTAVQAATLSGGNQQKFVIGRELEGSPDALIVENPTRGLDIRATSEVLTQLRAARDAGVAVVAYSSDLDEVLSVADRMLVCFNGTVTETAVDATAVGRAMLGAGA